MGAFHAFVRIQIINLKPEGSHMLCPPGFQFTARQLARECAKRRHSARDSLGRPAASNSFFSGNANASIQSEQLASLWERITEAGTNGGGCQHARYQSEQLNWRKSEEKLHARPPNMESDSLLVKGACSTWAENTGKTLLFFEFLANALLLVVVGSQSVSSWRITLRRSPTHR